MTDPRCPSRMRRSLLLGTSQSFTVLSRLPIASIRPFGSKSTLETGKKCFSNRRGTVPTSISQRARTSQNMPRGVKDHADDLAPRTAKRAKQFAVGRIPKIYSAIIGTAGQHLPRRMEGDTGNAARLPREGIK